MFPAGAELQEEARKEDLEEIEACKEEGAFDSQFWTYIIWKMTCGYKTGRDTRKHGKETCGEVDNGSHCLICILFVSFVPNLPDTFNLFSMVPGQKVP